MDATMVSSPVLETFDRPPAAVPETIQASGTAPTAGTVVTSQARPSKWKIILPPTRTPSGLKAMLRQVGMACSAAGRWHRVLTRHSSMALEPMVEAAQGQWEKA